MTENLHYIQNSRKTAWVTLITFIAMLTEISFGILTRSMSLLSDGIHMASHVFALGLSWLAYQFIFSFRKRINNQINEKKVLDLTAFTSGMILLVFAIMILIQSFRRLINPIDINAAEAIWVAVIGLIVNVICAFILHQKQGGLDINIHAAYLHVLADSLTSLTAIAGIFLTLWLNIRYFDTFGGIISALVIIRWSYGLIKTTGKRLCLNDSASGKPEN